MTVLQTFLYANDQNHSEYLQDYHSAFAEEFDSNPLSSLSLQFLKLTSFMGMSLSLSKTSMLLATTMVFKSLNFSMIAMFLDTDWIAKCLAVFYLIKLFRYCSGSISTIFIPLIAPLF